MMYSLFYTIYFFLSLKCILWLFESYKPTERSDKITEFMTSDDIVECNIVLILTNVIIYPMTYIFNETFPFLSTMTYVLMAILELITISNKQYRQKLCVFVKNLCTNQSYKNNNNDNNDTVKSEFHKLLRILYHTIDFLHNPVNIFNSHNEFSGEKQTDNTSISMTEMNDGTTEE